MFLVWGSAMSKPGDYRKYATECMKLAQRARASARASILRIAEAWLILADQAEQKMRLLADDRRHMSQDNQLN